MVNCRLPQRTCQFEVSPPFQTDPSRQVSWFYSIIVKTPLFWPSLHHISHDMIKQPRKVTSIPWNPHLLMVHSPISRFRPTPSSTNSVWFRAAAPNSELASGSSPGRCAGFPWMLRNISWEQKHGKSLENYFTSCDPHHDIYTFSYWQIFWHSIRHIFWHSIWHMFWHMFWHIFWHSIWHIFWHIIWQIFWDSLWHILWHSIWHFIWHSIWHTFWHSIWHIFWHSIWYIFWHSIWHIFWHSIWHISWHFIWHILWHSIWHSIWHIFWHSIWPLRSSGAHWAGQVPGWGPAVHTELGTSQVEVQRCTLSSEGPRLRSSGAHWAGKVPGWGPAVHTELGRSQDVPGWGPAVHIALLAKSLAKSWQGGSWGGSWCRHGRGETGGGGGGGGGRGELVEEEENSFDKI